MAIIRAVVGLGETFAMTVTAEGVETNEQAEQLALEDCTHLHGYLFSKPLPLSGVPAIFAQFSTMPLEVARPSDRGVKSPDSAFSRLSAQGAYRFATALLCGGGC